MTPEEQARQKIDRQFGRCGWVVQGHREMNLYAGPGVAVREFPLKTGFADYLLYLDGKAIGVVEAKPEGHTLTGVELQSAKYTEGLPEGLPSHGVPLPFAYESTGAITQFTDNLDSDPRSREVFTFHRMEALSRLVQLDFQFHKRRMQWLLSVILFWLLPSAGRSGSCCASGRGCREKVRGIEEQPAAGSHHAH